MDSKDTIIAELTKTIETLLKRIQKLEDEVARLKKDSNNSSKPPSSDIVKPNKKMRKRKTKKRKQGGQPGHKKHTRKPFTADEIDHTYEYELYGKDLVGLIPLDDRHVLQQVTLPEKLYVVTEHKARKYLDPKTGKIIIAFLPDEIQKGGGTEREIRHTVIDRRITQGTRGDTGMRWCERIWTIIATCKKQERNVFDFIHKSLLSNWTDKNYPLFL